MHLYLSLFYECDISVVGKIVPDNQYLIVSNHERTLDPFALVSMFPISKGFGFLPCSFMTANKFYFGKLHFLAKAIGCYPAQPNNKNVSYGVEAALNTYHDGSSVMIFPEGRRNSNPEGLPARHGTYKVIDAVGSVKLLICHIHWEGRKLRICYEQQNSSKFQNAQQILDRCYALSDDSVQ